MGKNKTTKKTVNRKIFFLFFLFIFCFILFNFLLREAKAIVCCYDQLRPGTCVEKDTFTKCPTGYFFESGSCSSCLPDKCRCDGGGTILPPPGPLPSMEELPSLESDKYISSPPKPPILSIIIPGLNLESDPKVLRVCVECSELVEDVSQCPDEKCARWTYKISWLGQYIIYFYKWLVGAIAIFAVLMIVHAGFGMITAAGNAEKIKGARDKIFASIMGIILIMVAHQVLAMINPELVIFKPIIIGGIKRIEFEMADGDPGQREQEIRTGKAAPRTAETINSIYIHYTYSTFGDVKQIRVWHTTREKPFIDIGYHYVILNEYRKSGVKNTVDDGLIEKGRDDLVIGAHAMGCNRYSIGVAFVGKTAGKSHKESMTEKQLASLRKLVNELRQKYNIPVERVFGHNECPGQETNSCPGFINMEEFRKSL